MPSSWDVYYVVFLAALLALAIPATLALLSRIVSPEKASEKKVSPSSGESQMGNRFNSRFFLAANAAMLLVGLILLVIPVIGTLGSEDSGSAALALIVVISMSLLSFLALIYAARKGDLSWIKPQSPDERES